MRDKNEIIITSSSGRGLQKLLKALKAEHFEIKLYSQEVLLKSDIQWRQLACLIINVDADESTGNKFPGFFIKLKQLNPKFPVIFLIPKESISWAVKAAKMRMRHIHEKPLLPNAIQAIIDTIQSEGQMEHTFLQDLLSPKEKQVLNYILRGYTNKKIASLIKKSVRTIEEHRANVMSKMGVDNVTELFSLAVQANLLESEGKGDEEE